ncbi:hypothetical protein MVEG_08127 [Podila verticillata NRRL 6337]|nr:hypothetical protein MVEG_08127 [Podila verticillata NRRL 6337]
MFPHFRTTAWIPGSYCLKTSYFSPLYLHGASAHQLSLYPFFQEYAAIIAYESATARSQHGAHGPKAKSPQLYPKQTPSPNVSELGRVIAHLQANFPFIQGVMDVPPGTEVLRLEDICKAIQADSCWNRTFLDKMQQENNNVAAERDWYLHDNDKIRAEYDRTVTERNKLLEESERSKAELKRYHIQSHAAEPFSNVEEADKSGWSSVQSVPLETPEAQAINPLQDIDNNAHCKQEAQRVKVPEGGREGAIQAIEAQLSITEQARQVLQDKLQQEHDKSKTLAIRLQSSEQLSSRRSKELDAATKRVAALGEKDSEIAMITLELGQCQQDLFKARAAIAARDEEVLKLGKAKEHKESEITAITQELEQYKMDLTKAQASIEQRDEEVFKMKNDKEAKEVAVLGEKECDFMRITRGLAHYQEEVVKAQATISEKDKQVLKMGEVREHDLRVLVNMLAEQEQGIEDMQVQRDKDVQKIKTLENTCQTLREQLSAPRRKGSVSMQLRSQKRSKNT